MTEILDIKVSVIIPTHKPIIPFLKQALESLANQNGVDQFRYEVIVVENPELTTEVAMLIEKLNIINVRHITSSLGSNKARNTGILEAKYNYIALMDDDCVPNSDWLYSLIHAHFFFPDAGILGGPLELLFECERPLWMVGDILPILSQLDWNPESHVGSSPFELINVPNRYMISANLSFTKNRFNQAGRFNTEIGLHGKETYISNDEIQFIERAAQYGEPKMLWVPQLKMKHIIPEDRCTIDFLENKARGQGFGDGIMWQQENPHVPIGDLYHNYLQNAAIHYIDYDKLIKSRIEISDEFITRTHIRNLIRIKTAYMQGAINAIENRDINE